MKLLVITVCILKDLHKFTYASICVYLFPSLQDRGLLTGGFSPQEKRLVGSSSTICP